MFARAPLYKLCYAALMDNLSLNLTRQLHYWFCMYDVANARAGNVNTATVVAAATREAHAAFAYHPELRTEGFGTDDRKR
jgi:hypothetical protein